MADLGLSKGNQGVTPGFEPTDSKPSVIAASPNLDRKVAEEIRVHRVMVESVGAQFEMATPGSPRRMLYEELLNGASEADALRRVPSVDLGPRPERTMAMLKAWADERRIWEGRVADSNLTPAQVAANRMVTVRIVGDESIRDNAARVGAAIYESRMFNAVQNEAVRAERERINKGLEVLGPKIEKMKEAGDTNSEAYRNATRDYNELMKLVVPTGAAGVAIYKGMAAEDAKRLLEIGDEHGDYDLAGLKLATKELNQDLGVVGQVREPSGSTQEGWRFRGWNRDQDVVLNPAHEAEIAFQADGNHNADYLQARMEAGEAKAMPFYEHVNRVHGAALDKPVEFAPRYDPKETLAGAAAGGMLLWQPRTGGLTLEGEIVPPAAGGAGPDGLRRLPGRPPELPGGALGDREFTGADVYTPSPIVVTAQHSDFSAHAEDAMRQHRAAQARLLTSAGLAGLQGALGLMEGASRWAASPDTGMSGFFFTNAHLALNGVSTGVQTYHQSRDAKERAFGTLIQEMKEKNSLEGRAFANQSLGAYTQLQKLVPPANTLHKAEMEVRNLMRPTLDLGWNQYTAAHSTDMYKDLFSQAMTSGNQNVQKLAEKGLNEISKAQLSGKVFTQADFDRIVESNRSQAVFSSEGGAFDRLRQVSGMAANDGAAHLRSIERNFMDAKRIRFEQEALVSDRGRGLLMSALARQDDIDGMAGPRGEMNFAIGPIDPKTGQRTGPTITEADALQSFQAKWSAERDLISANVAMIDDRPELAAAMKEQGLDAASLLESTYTDQSSASSNSVRVADAIRTWAEKPQNFSMPPDQSLVPKGWNADGSRQVGVADLGNGQYAALLVGHDLDGKAMDAKVLVFQRQDDGNIRLAGRVNIDPKDMTSFLDGPNPDKLKQTITTGLEVGVRDSILRQKALLGGLPVSSLPAHEFAAAQAKAQQSVAGTFRFLDDRAVMGSLSRAVAQSATSTGFQKLTTAPAMASIVEFPKPGNITNMSVQDRFRNGLDVAIGRSNDLAQRGIRQMQDLHGLNPLTILDRLDSNRNHGEKRREFDALRGMYDGPHKREWAKSSLFEPLMADHSAPGHHGPVVIDDPWPVGRP